MAKKLTLERLRDLIEMARPYPHIKGPPTSIEIDVVAALRELLAIRETEGQAPPTAQPKAKGGGS